ncbi:putative penicillin amidase [Gordonia araii NBRC 100433]|uniref:Putative penicillin amidase n=1 Tax=Gordonia araii NBRC 100433 TaxID=1073574 RepID=G7GX69_9ACTN|nr:penicillin acylase family protein [Gordonia araii]NNG98175.1 penicillin acylase family protein [Gordonia araii NBRC 100433]GAB08194.1 putative penicillin amidase [Gordonia araii NBRC 100433]
MTVQYEHETIRDEWGIPHVWGTTAAGVVYGQGRACAQDRAWQIEFLRLRAEGRTAEAFGPIAVEWDRFARRSGMDRSARAVYERSTPRTRELLDAYVAGVNSALESSRAPELDELDHRPSPWQPWTPIAVFLMHHILFGRFTTKLWRVQTARAFGRDGLTMFDFEGDGPLSADAPDLPDEEFVADLLAGLADRGLDTGLPGGGLDTPSRFAPRHSTTDNADRAQDPADRAQDPADRAQDPADRAQDPADRAQNPADCAHPGDAISGSNAWGVTSARTSTGGALIAGDPHRFLELPGIYLQCQLGCPEFDVVGFAFAGVPGVPHFAHAQEVAWAITNAMGDYQDLYREKLARDGDGITALTPDGVQPAQSWTETIAVRGGDDVSVEIVVTENGPVILGGADEGYALSLRSPMLAGSEGFSFDAVLDLLFARSIADVEDALESWSEPVNRIVIADAEGRVHRQVVGAMPRRASENYWLPVPGWDERYRWAGYHAASVADESFDGEVADSAVIANQRITDCPPLQPVTTEAVAPGRANRITELLADDENVSVDACTEIHRDVYLDDASDLVDLIKPLTGLSAGAEQIRARLVDWDRSMAADSVEAYLFAALRTRLVGPIAGHDALAKLREPHGFSPIFDPWFAPHPRIGAAFATVLSRSAGLGVDTAGLAATSLESLAETTGGGADAPTWGEHHRFAPIHGFDLMGASPAHPELAARVRPDRAPLGGDAECVFANASAVGFDDQCRVGSAARYVWDLADRDRGRWIVPMGVDGDPGAAHFQDQLPLWARGETIPVVSDWAVLREVRGASDGADPSVSDVHASEAAAATPGGSR